MSNSCLRNVAIVKCLRTHWTRIVVMYNQSKVKEKKNRGGCYTKSKDFYRVVNKHPMKSWNVSQPSAVGTLHSD